MVNKDLEARFEKWQEDKKRVEVLFWDIWFDETLKDLIMLHFSRQDKTVKKLFEPSIGGPLVSLTNKARLAYAMGLIGKTLQDDLEQMHNIRNKFAHHNQIDFTNDELLKSVKELSPAKGNQVTVENSHRIYHDALKSCIKNVLETLFQDELNKREAMEAGK